MPRRTHHAESVDKRASVVVANGTPLSVRIRFGSPYSWNSRVKIGFASVDGRRRQRLAAQEIAAEPIGHRQRIAVPPVAGPELALVVRTPDVVGSEDLARRLAGMADAPALPFDRHHPMALQDVARRRPPRAAAIADGACATAPAASCRPSVGCRRRASRIAAHDLRRTSDCGERRGRRERSSRPAGPWRR